MVAIFLEELSELVEAFDETTQQLLDDPQDKEAIAVAERQLHTIKGGARMTGLSAIGDLSHAGESLLNLVANEKVSIDDSLLEKLQKVSDELFRMYDLAASGSEIEPVSELIDQLHSLSDNSNKSPVSPAESPVVSEEVTEDTTETEKQGESDQHLDAATNNGSDDKSKEAEEVNHEVDPMVSIYLEELSELVESFDDTTQKLIENYQDADAIADAERQLHTIKGGARMTGLTVIGDLSHAGESLLNLVSTNKVDVDDSLLEKLQQVSDTLYKMYELAANGKVIEPVDELINQLHVLAGLETESIESKEVEKVLPSEQEEGASNDTSVTDSSVTNASTKVATESEGANEGVNLVQKEEAETEADPGYKIPDFSEIANDASELEQTLAQFADDLNSDNLLSAISANNFVEPVLESQNNSSIRVPTGLINKLITTTNEWGHQNIRLTEQYDENRNTINELKRTASRLKEQIRNLELEADSSIHAGGPVSSLPKLKGSFDPLEMDEYTELQQQSRSLSESLGDLMSLTESLDKGLKDMEVTSESQESTCKNVQEGLISTRMTKVNGLLSRLKRIVRQVSSELGKQVSLEIVDENCEMDRTILERITASLEHLIRNSLAHGVEKPEDRVKSGKDTQGKIVLEISRDGPEIVITLQDDGAGIDVERLRALSVKKGLIEADAVLSNKEIYQLILMSGVSTADKVSQVAGRGVGMDVVNAEVNSLGGNIVIDSERGKFTSFVLSVPYNLATNQVMLLEESGEVLAVPVAKLEGMQRVSSETLSAAYASEHPTVECAGKTYTLRHLGATLGLASKGKINDPGQTLPVILFQENGKRVAYQVDEVRGNREVMLKPLGVLFEESQLISSASILGGGQIVLLLNAHELINLGVSGKAISSRKEVRVKTAEKQTIMVVDDSITVRKITESLLLSLNYKVLTANDGVSALEVLTDEMPDLMLLDIEMPRMDGFELLENVRTSEEWKEIPVIMISSRSGAKHRQHAQSLGANGFIGKPWEAEQLARDIKGCLSPTKEVMPA